MQPDDIRALLPIFSGAIGALAALLAAAIGALAALRIARSKAAAPSPQREALAVQMHKLEDLMERFDRWREGFARIPLYYLQCYHGALSFRQATEAASPMAQTAAEDARQYQTLLEVHFPALRSAHAAVDEARQRLVPFFSDPAVSKLAVQDFAAAQSALEAACAQFKAAITAHAQSLYAQ